MSSFPTLTQELSPSLVGTQVFWDATPSIGWPNGPLGQKARRGHNVRPWASQTSLASAQVVVAVMGTTFGFTGQQYNLDLAG